MINLDDHTLQVVAVGAGLLGVVAGALGTFAVLRRQALVGDAISHAALPGVVLAYLVTGAKGSLALMIGAALAGFAATLAVSAVIRTTRVKQDAALGIALSVFFGLGLVLLTYVQRQPDASQAGLDRFLFGQAAALLEEDVRTIAVAGAAALVVLALLWKQVKLLTFDADFAASIGLRTRAVDVVLTGLLVVAIVIGLQTVGVVLMSALIVAPAAAARQWTDRLGVMTMLAGGFGALSGAVGAGISAEVERTPTGPAIVLVATLIVVVSLAFAPRRGLVPAAFRSRVARRRVAGSEVLRALHTLEVSHDGADRSHAAPVVSAITGVDAAAALRELERRGSVRRHGDLWALTDTGRQEVDTP